MGEGRYKCVIVQDDPAAMQNARLPAHSESPGMIIDRLSNMALRESQLTPRPGTPEPYFADGAI